MKFGTLLLLAQEGDEQAKEKILRLYRPLLFREALWRAKRGEKYLGEIWDTPAFSTGGG